MLENYPVPLKPSGTLKGFEQRHDGFNKLTRLFDWFTWPEVLASAVGVSFDPIATELRHMEASGVNERINASQRMFNVAAAMKKDGSLRLCVNLTAVNKTLVIDRHPLSTTDELTAVLTGNG